MTEPTRYGQADDVDIEAPEADVLEQDLDSYDDGAQDTERDTSRESPLEADPTDAAEQERWVDTDEDEYR